MLSLQTILLLFLDGFQSVHAQGGPLPCTGPTRACAAQITDGAHPTPPLSSRLADCSSYQAVVVTPEPTTLTTTVATLTVTTTTTLGAPARRDNAALLQVTSTPTAVPTYLDDPCTSPGVYGAACACLGIGRTTTTLATQTSTVSVTATTTTTVTVTPTPTACDARTCGSYTGFECNPDDPFDTCSCGFDSNGDSFCFDSGPSCAQTTQCTVNTDCPAGSRCLVGSCCFGNICAVEVPGGCTPPSQLQQLQQRQQQGGAAAAAVVAGNCTIISPCDAAADA